MTPPPVVGRFAPSPSGRMHLGNVFCALLAWLSVRAQDGQFILRIEDLDTARCPHRHTLQLLDDLRWLGLDWDIGPQSDMPEFAHYQSLRAPIYQHYLDILDEQGRIYPCFCTRAQLHAASAPHASDGQVRYTGTCLGLTATQIAQQTRRPALRLHVPAHEITVHDRLQPTFSVSLPRDCGDYIVQRADGTFGYQLAVVVDDGLQGVTEVVRGKDLLSSTPWQIALFEQLGFPVPAFCHIPLLVDTQGRRLSKRDADLDLHALRQKYQPEQLIGLLACAAGLQAVPSPRTAQSLVADFDWHKIPTDSVCLHHIHADF